MKPNAARKVLGPPVSDFLDDDAALEAFSDVALERYARHLILPEMGARRQQRLAQARVVLVGMGGIGCPAAQALAQVGVGALSLIDPDTVDLSNLPRQTLFRSADVGRPKAMVAAEVLEEINPDLSVSVNIQPLRAANVEALLANHSLIIDGTDNFSTRCLVAQWAQHQDVPLVAASVTGTEGQLLCLDNQTRRYEALFPEGPPPQQNCADVGVLATSSMLMGQLAAHAAVQWIASEERPASQLVSTWPLRVMRLGV